VLVTITDVFGTSSRQAGHHMAVSETGASIGSISGGCVEAAVVGEALRALEDGRPQMIRFGAGSPLIDIRLPCGGGIDLHFLPNPPQAVLVAALTNLEHRRPIALAIDLVSGALRLDNFSRGGPHERSFIARHHPDLHLTVIGHGEECLALTRLALAYGAGVRLLSPDHAIVEAGLIPGVEAELLKTPASLITLEDDRYGAVVLLFHDHDWEADLLEQVLRHQLLFVGAMGSRGTQARRLAELEARGVPAERRHLVESPVGLIPSTRDPETLALSILAEAAQRHAAAVATASLGSANHRPQKLSISDRI
jgi:xanthine dehydrogenase accessory factor